MAGTSNSITTHNVLSGVLNADNVISGLVNTAFNPAYALVTQAGAQIVLFINNNDYKMYAQLKDKSGNVIYTSNIIDLPLETMVVNGRYDSNTKKLILVLDNGNEIEIPLGALISGLVNEDDLEANYYDKNEIDTLLEGYWTKIEITQEDIDNWNAKQEYLNQGDGIEISAETTLKGNTSQESTTGKNMLNIANLTAITKNGITLTKNNDGTITLNGTASGDANFVFAIDNITATSDYKAQIYKQSGSFTNNYVSLYLSIDSAFSSFDLLSMTSSDMIQMSLGNKTYTHAQVKVNGGVVCNNLKIGVQVVNGTTNTFEPYTNGASPNPDYPQDIQVVSGDNEINVVGKNLCKIEAHTYQDLSRAPSVGQPLPLFNTNGTIKIKIDLSTFDKSEAYTVSARNDITNLRCFYCDSNDLYISSERTSNPRTLSIPTNASVLYIFIKISNVTDLTPVPLEDYELQIEVGSSATDFDPYQGNTYNIDLPEGIELCKIGDYQDKIYKDNGKWYLNKQIGKVVLDGSENWSAFASVNYEYQLSLFAGLSTDTSNQYFPALCNKYINHNVAGSSLSNYEFSHFSTQPSTVKERFVRFRNNDITTLANWKTELQTNNAILYVPLATPTTTEITDTTLISQLNALTIGLSNNWVENVSQTNADLPFEIEYDNKNLTISANLTDYYTKTETNTLLNVKVGFTDYPSTTTAGVIKISYESGATRSDSGYIGARTWTYTQYQNVGNGSFISKGTLENVITGKDLTTKTYVDGLVGDIETLLDNLNTGSGV